MSIVNILLKTLILLTCGLIQMTEVLIEGCARLFDKLVEYLEKLHDLLTDQIDKLEESKKTDKKSL